MWSLVINSFVSNQQAVNVLLDSISSSDWTDTQIFVVVGGTRLPYALEERQHGRVKYIQIRAPHNSIDFTGMISLVEVQDPRIVCDFYMIIHDTCTVEAPFFSTLSARIKNLPLHGVAPLCPFPSFNTGVYSRGVLIANEPFLRENRSPDGWTDQDAQYFKSKGVYIEDMIFRGQQHIEFLSEKVHVGQRDVYGNGVNRFEQHFPGAHLTKYQANWTIKDLYEMNL